MNDNKPENPKAFPNTDPEYFGATDSHGMDLRDYFAAKALQALMTNAFYTEWVMKKFAGNGKAGTENYAEEAYTMADAMLKERVKP